MLTHTEIAFKITPVDINDPFETYDIFLKSSDKPLNSSRFNNVPCVARNMIRNGYDVIVQFRGNCEFVDKSRHIWLHDGVAGGYVQDGKYHVHYKIKIEHFGENIAPSDPYIETNTYDFALTNDGLSDAGNKMSKIISELIDEVIKHA